jgi:hypothetical protein
MAQVSYIALATLRWGSGSLDHKHRKTTVRR